MFVYTIRLSLQLVNVRSPVLSQVTQYRALALLRTIEAVLSSVVMISITAKTNNLELVESKAIGGACHKGITIPRNGEPNALNLGRYASTLSH
jgi:hypothetical protein